jgi:hypothetical protein
MQPRNTRREGSVLLLATVLSLVVLLTVVASVNTAASLGKSVQRDFDRTAAMCVAEGVTEIAQRQLLDQVTSFLPPAPDGTVTLAGVAYPYTATPLGDPFTETADDGVTMSIQRYTIHTGVAQGESEVNLDRIVDLTMTPVFQYMIFYADDLELLPGPSMTLSGRVHANGDIYVGCGSTLTVDTESFQCTGDILRKRKNDNSESTGTVRIRVKDDGTYANLTNAQDSEYSDWANYALDTWNGTVQDSAHGVREVAAPNIGSIQAFEPDGSKGYYHENAGLVIVNDKAYDENGNEVDLSGALAQRTMYDAREGKNVTVSQIDVGLLNASGHFPGNGLIYAYRTDASSSQPNGIRLVNGSELAGPLTVVSEDPVYVKGDFNTVNKQGAAVIADAVNLLSKTWSDSGGTLQVATATTYNLAFVTGIVPTPDGGGAYSGGFENLPRFHENWTGVPATIRGSFVNLFESQIARAPWQTGSVYRPPLRDWRYDPDLNDLDNLPPFTPQAAYFQRVLWDDHVPQPF